MNNLNHFATFLFVLPIVGVFWKKGPKPYKPFNSNKGKPIPTDPLIAKLVSLDPDSWRKGEVEGVNHTNCYNVRTPKGKTVAIVLIHIPGSDGTVYDGLRFGDYDSQERFELYVDGVREQASYEDLSFLFRHASYCYWKGPTGQAEHFRDVARREEEAKKIKRSQEEYAKRTIQDAKRQKEERQKRSDSL